MTPEQAIIEIERVLQEPGVVFWQRFDDIRRIIDRIDWPDEDSAVAFEAIRAERD